MQRRINAGLAKQLVGLRNETCWLGRKRESKRVALPDKLLKLPLRGRKIPLFCME